MKKPILKLLSSLSFAALLSSCDWSSGGEANSYNSRYDWVNYSGVYRPVSGKYVVTNYSDGVPATEGTPSESYQENASEQVATGTGAQTAFAGTVSNSFVVAGSFSLTTAGFNLVDDGSGGLSGGGVTGTIVYTTGAWSVDFGGVAPDAGTPINASYTYTVTTNSVPGTEAQPPSPGSTGFELFSFTVQQGGERVTFTDSTGRSYEGNMGSISTTRGATANTSDDVADPVVGDVVIGLFNAAGVSPAGINVKLTGVFQAEVGSGGQLINRELLGTWIEEGGVAGDINAEASSISVDINT